MSYGAGEALILAAVRTASGFTSTNTDAADWGLLNRGKAQNYAILRPGSFATSWSALRGYTVTWTTVVEVWQRCTTNPATDRANLYTAVSALITALMPKAYMTDSSLVEDATIEGGEEPAEMWGQSGSGPQWLRWNIRVIWRESATVSSFS